MFQIEAFWVVMLCSVVVGYQRFIGPCFLLPQGEMAVKCRFPIENPDGSFETFTAVMFQVEVFWVMTLCNVVVGYQRFIGSCCLHLQGEVAVNCSLPIDVPDASFSLLIFA